MTSMYTSESSAPARSSGGTGRSSARPPAPRRFGGRRKVCPFCADKEAVLDYKAVGRLRRYVSERARMESGKKTGTCARHQRQVRQAIKRARFMALLPYAADHRRTTGPIAVRTEDHPHYEDETDMAESSASQNDELSATASSIPEEPVTEEPVAEPQDDNARALAEDGQTEPDSIDSGSDENAEADETNEVEPEKSASESEEESEDTDQEEPGR